MKLPPGFWKKKKLEKDKKCFLCEGPLGKNSGEIVYQYDAGEGRVEICEICMDKIEGKDDEQSV